jgi:hypothetical protein
VYRAPCELRRKARPAFAAIAAGGGGVSAAYLHLRITQQIILQKRTTHSIYIRFEKEREGVLSAYAAPALGPALLLRADSGSRKHRVLLHVALG